MNQLRLCSRCLAQVAQAAFKRCPCTHSSEIGIGRRALPRGGTAGPSVAPGCLSGTTLPIPPNPMHKMGKV